MEAVSHLGSPLVLSLSVFEVYSAFLSCVQYSRCGHTTEICNGIMKVFLLFFILSVLVPVVHTL